MRTDKWDVDSWQSYPAEQQPEYDAGASAHLDSVKLHLSQQPGIVCFESVQELRLLLSEVHGDPSLFLIHAGDCAETFDSCDPERVSRDSALISDLGSLLDAPVCIGRICGQFAKPRSSPLELCPRRGSLPVYRGDLINGTSSSSRSPDPSRMLTAYSHSASLAPIATSPTFALFTSHECLLLPYESALVRQPSTSTEHYSSSAHFLWIGDRTRNLDGAHIEFCRGLFNPIGIKVGPSSDPAEIRECVKRLNPENEPGKITVITRFGAGNAPKYLPSMIRALKGLCVLYQCDPMHGNTVVVGGGRKTRYVSEIKKEIEETVAVHKELGSRLHGLHLETTGEDNVTECVGCGVREDDLGERYMSACDPRLNPVQARKVVEFTRDAMKKAGNPLRMTTDSTAESTGVSSDEDHYFSNLIRGERDDLVNTR